MLHLCVYFVSVILLGVYNLLISLLLKFNALINVKIT